MNDLEAILTRIQRRLKRAGLTKSAASEKAGAPDAIRNLERAITENRKNPIANRKGISTATLSALAPVLKTTPEWLLSAVGPEEPDAAQGSSAIGEFAVQRAKVIGTVQAGVWNEFESFEDDGYGEIEVNVHPGQWAHMPQFSYAVRGKSMDQAGILDGDYVICVRYLDARKDITHGDIAVIERKKNSAVERSVKQIELHGKKVHFCPRSSDPRFKPIIFETWRSKDSDDEEISIIGLVVGLHRSF